MSTLRISYLVWLISSPLVEILYSVQCTLYSKDVVFGFVNQISYLIGLHTSYLVWIMISSKDFKMSSLPWARVQSAVVPAISLSAAHIDGWNKITNLMKYKREKNCSQIFTYCMRKQKIGKKWNKIFLSKKRICTSLYVKA